MELRPLRLARRDHLSKIVSSIAILSDFGDEIDSVEIPKSPKCAFSFRLYSRIIRIKP
jgi:hypothetical protein